jgi:hypothetical protein
MASHCWQISYIHMYAYDFNTNLSRYACKFITQFYSFIQLIKCTASLGSKCCNSDPNKLYTSVCNSASA